MNTWPPCESDPIIPSCSFVERTFGEAHTAVVHGFCAVVFLAGLAIMSMLFAAAEVIHDGPGRPRIDKPRVFALHLGCAAIIVLAGAWAIIGGALDADWGELTPLYAGEVGVIEAFGVSWLVAGIGVTAPARRPGNEHAAAADSIPVS